MANLTSPSRQKNLHKSVISLVNKKNTQNINGLLVSPGRLVRIKLGLCNGTTMYFRPGSEPLTGNVDLCIFGLSSYLEGSSTKAGPHHVFSECAFNSTDVLNHKNLSAVLGIHNPLKQP